jgi:hypothetical protein
MAVQVFGHAKAREWMQIPLAVVDEHNAHLESLNGKIPAEIAPTPWHLSVLEQILMRIAWDSDPRLEFGIYG